MRNKGITLIALIVTVIIMVILASVTINLVTNGGLIDETRKATQDYTYEAEKEEWELAIAAGKNFITGEISKTEVEKSLSKGWEVVSEEDKLLGISPNKNNFTAVYDGENIISKENIENEILVFGVENWSDLVEQLDCSQEQLNELEKCKDINVKNLYTLTLDDINKDNILRIETTENLVEFIENRNNFLSDDYYKEAIPKLVSYTKESKNTMLLVVEEDKVIYNILDFKNNKLEQYEFEIISKEKDRIRIKNSNFGEVLTVFITENKEKSYLVEYGS